MGETTFLTGRKKIAWGSLSGCVCAMNLFGDGGALTVWSSLRVGAA